jgi:flagellar protein FliS
MMQNPYLAYKNQDIDTSSPYELVGKLYGAGAANLRKAAVYVRENRLDLASDRIIKTQQILTALNDTLDMQYDISQNLRQLYVYMYKRLVEANIHKDTAILDEVAGTLTEFRDTWDQAVKNFKMGV